MPDIVLFPSRAEFDANPVPYEELAGELTASGYEVELRPPTPKRGVEHAAADLIVQIGEFAKDHVDEVIVGLIVAKLSGLRLPRKERTPPRRVAILGPDGNPVKEFELQDDDG